MERVVDAAIGWIQCMIRDRQQRAMERVVDAAIEWIQFMIRDRQQRAVEHVIDALQHEDRYEDRN